MPELPFPDHVRELLRKPDPSVITTLRPDGQPVSAAGDQTRISIHVDLPGSWAHRLDGQREASARPARGQRGGPARTGRGSRPDRRDSP
ncbi:MAG: hypothetical protein M3237_13415 [Actinomycetota bacterium]|nr:hypothetical protein [Actinomycetota bacterium]